MIPRVCAYGGCNTNMHGKNQIYCAKHKKEYENTEMSKAIRRSSSAMSIWTDNAIKNLVQVMHFDTEDGTVAPNHDSILAKCLACGVTQIKLERIVRETTEQITKGLGE